MNTYKNPSWWTKENDSSWDKVKAALQRDWDQTKHDIGGKQPDTDQQVTDTVKQAAGKEIIPPRGVPTFDKAEPAYRLGVGARSYYAKKYPTWSPELETQLHKDWDTVSEEEWDENAQYVREGWDHRN